MLLKNRTEVPPATKVDLKKLRNIPKQDFSLDNTFVEEPRLYTLTKDNFRFDFLWHPKPNSDLLFVLFSGHAARKKLSPPVFQRWKWADLFPGHCLYISDPSLYLHERLGLAWYAGTSGFDPAPVIADIVREAANQLRIDDQKIWTYGSSGGGFAALRMLRFLPTSGAICVNPQTNIVSYRPKSVEVFLKVCFNNMSRKEVIKEHPHRISLLSDPEVYKQRSIIYLQNTIDDHHYRCHYTPFCESLGVDVCPPVSLSLKEHRTGNFHAIHFHHPEGHRKGETPEAFSRAIEIAETWTTTGPATLSA